jgi:hypothetical protein
MKTVTLLFAGMLFLTSACTNQKSKTRPVEEKEQISKTQAYLGVKEGGEWFWVTKSNGNEQWEYQGGEFKPVSALKVDEKHTDHSFDIQYEGPGWESDKIGYRIYLDWRNAIDIFGKKTDTLVLQNVGLDGFDSYHEEADWGVDVLKVGASLGMGSVGFWDGEKAVRVEKTDSLFSEVENQKSLSLVRINYYGWEINNTKTTLKTSLEISEGSYLTKYSHQLSSALPNLATGIVKHENTDVEVYKDVKEGWTCLVTFGVQTLQNDKLGMCVFVRTDQLIEITEDKNSHVLVLKPFDNALSYYFGAAWQQDASGVSTIGEFKEILKEQARYIQ